MAKRERYWVHSDPTGPDPPDRVDAVATVHDADSPPCPGDCNRLWRQAEKRAAEALAKGYRVKPHEIEPIPGAPVWCRNCQTAIRDALGRLPELAAYAASMPGGKLAQTAETEGRFATRDGSPSGSPAWDVADEIVRWALRWEDLLRAHLGQVYETPKLVRAALFTKVTDLNRPARLVALGPVLKDPTARRKLTAAVRYLDTWLTPLLSSPMALDSGRQTLNLARRAVGATGRDRVVHHLPLPCLQCDKKALRRDDGSETVYCRACDSRWTWEDYDRLAAAYAHGRPKPKVGAVVVGG